MDKNKLWDECEKKVVDFLQGESKHMAEMPHANTYTLIKDLLRKEGWKEQRSGEHYINGERGTNFGKEGEIIHVAHIDWADEEEYEDLFSSE